MDAWERLLASVRTNDAVVGLVLSGSRGRGEGRPESDWDCYVIAGRGLHESELSEVLDPSVDASIMTLEDFRMYANPGTVEEWDAYAFAHARIVHDRLDGEIGRIAAAKEFLPSLYAEDQARRALDAYLNSAVRRAKCERDGEHAGAVLDAAESIAWAMETLFAIEGRVRPFNRYLAWELERHPLVGPPTRLELPPLMTAVASGAAAPSAALFGVIEARAREAGLGDVLEQWDERALARARSGS